MLRLSITEENNQHFVLNFLIPKRLCNSVSQKGKSWASLNPQRACKYQRHVIILILPCKSTRSALTGLLGSKVAEHIHEASFTSQSLPLIWSQFPGYRHVIQMSETG